MKESISIPTNWLRTTRTSTETKRISTAIATTETEKLNMTTTTERPMSKSKTTKMKHLVKLIREGPTAGESIPTTRVLTDENVDMDAPMPRRKTRYELFLKHKVREAQIRSYNDLMKKDGTLVRCGSATSMSTSSSNSSYKHVRFADGI